MCCHVAKVDGLLDVEDNQSARQSESRRRVREGEGRGRCQVRQDRERSTGTDERDMRRHFGGRRLMVVVDVDLRRMGSVRICMGGTAADGPVRGADDGLERSRGDLGMDFSAARTGRAAACAWGPPQGWPGLACLGLAPRRAPAETGHSRRWKCLGPGDEGAVPARPVSYSVQDARPLSEVALDREVVLGLGPPQALPSCPFQGFSPQSAKRRALHRACHGGHYPDMAALRSGLRFGCLSLLDHNTGLLEPSLGGSRPEAIGRHARPPPQPGSDDVCKKYK